MRIRVGLAVGLVAISVAMPTAVFATTYALGRIGTTAQNISSNTPCQPSESNCVDQKDAALSAVDVSNGALPDAAGRADLAQGTLRARAQVGGVGQAVGIAYFSDVLNFSGAASGTVTLVLDVHGVIEPRQPNNASNGARIQSFLCAGTTGASGIPSCFSGFTSEVTIFNDATSGEVIANPLVNDFNPNDDALIDAIVLDDSHARLSMTIRVGGLSSFSFTAGLFTSAARTNGSGTTAADAWNTAQLSLIASEGVTVTSGSGVLLSAVVPEPRAWVMVVIGIVLVAGATGVRPCSTLVARAGA